MRKKKQYPEGTFISTPARICAILHLCLAFSALLWFMSTPYLGEMFENKSDKLLFSQVMESSRYGDLPLETRSRINKGHEELMERGQVTFIEKLMKSFDFRRMNVYEAGWVLLSIVLPILLLKKVEGATQAVWLLPLITLAYMVNVANYEKDSIGLEARLFPTEQKIRQEYLDEPFSDDMMEQRRQLIKGWKSYLATEWSREGDAEAGEFAFNVARVEKRIEDRRRSRGKVEVASMLSLVVYLGWNFVFALTVAYTYGRKSVA